MLTSPIKSNIYKVNTSTTTNTYYYIVYKSCYKT